LIIIKYDFHLLSIEKKLINHSVEKNTVIIAALVLAAALVVTMAAILLKQFAMPIAASGIITFFGMLIISGYNKKSTKAKGIIRRAIASALIVSYIIAFSIFMFQTFEQVEQSMLDEKSLPDVKNMTSEDVNEYMLLLNQTASINLLKMEFTNSLLVNFTNVIMVIIVFYFGSKGVLQYLKDRKPGSSTDQVTQDLHNSVDNQLNKIKEEVKQAEKEVEQTEKDLAADPANETLIKKNNDAKVKLVNLKEKEGKLKRAKGELEGSTKIINKIHYNIEKSESPLVAGFYLEGPTIAHRKRWHFGDESVPKINNNLIQNHRYDKVGVHTMWVEIINDLDEVIEKSNEIKFTVTEKTTAFNFDQREGVIYQDDDVGFSLATNITSPTIKWDWGNGETSSDTNPHPKFVKDGAFQGSITVSGSGVEPESREFGVLVLPSMLKRFTGFIEAGPTNQSEKKFVVGEEVTFNAQITGGFRPIYLIQWAFGDSHTQAGKEEVIIAKNTYKKPDDYVVTCKIRDRLGRKITLHKVISVVKK